MKISLGNGSRRRTNLRRVRRRRSELGYDNGDKVRHRAREDPHIIVELGGQLVREGSRCIADR